LAVKECYKMDAMFSPEAIAEENLQPNHVMTLF
jgi:hypothetical protein